jgi:hypothetical protein
MVTGTLTSNGAATDVNGRLRGDQITFKIGDAEYTGRVNGTSMEGSVKNGPNGGSWKAERK